MNRAVLAVAVLAAWTSVASAGTYVGLGIGTAASVSESSGPLYNTDGRSGRLALGWRLGRFSIEGAYTGYGLVQTQTDGNGKVDSHTVQAAGKLNFPLGNNFEMFGRAGFLRTWLSPSDSSSGAMDLTGNGYTLSAGFEYRLDLGLAGGSIFVDYSHNNASLSGSGTSATLEQTATMWTLGVNLSI